MVVVYFFYDISVGSIIVVLKNDYLQEDFAREFIQCYTPSKTIWKITKQAVAQKLTTNNQQLLETLNRAWNQNQTKTTISINI